MAIDAALRKSQAIAASGYGYSKFHQAINDGEFPKPDYYVGRLPIWLESTIAKWREAKIAERKPVLDLPMLRSRKARQ